MPSTSVQISMESASRAAPTIAAEKSDPPRPKVVVVPFCVAAINPPITGIRDFAISLPSLACVSFRVSSASGNACVCRASVTMHCRESTQTVSRPRTASAAATISLETNSPKERSWSLLRGENSRIAARPRRNASTCAKETSNVLFIFEKAEAPSSCSAVSKWRLRKISSNCKADSPSPAVAC